MAAGRSGAMLLIGCATSCASSRRKRESSIPVVSAAARLRHRLRPVFAVGFGGQELQRWNQPLEAANGLESAISGGVLAAGQADTIPASCAAIIAATAWV